MGHDQRSRGHRLRVVAALLTLALVAAACGDDDDAVSGEDGDPQESDAAEVLGEPNPASGEPVVVGIISASESDSPLSAQFQRVEQGMEAAIEYANEYRGGIAGRPIELFICQGGETPAGSQDCANQMVNREVAAVVSPFTATGASMVPVLAAGEIPFFVLSGASAEELTTPGVFVLTGGYPSTLAAFAADARDSDVEKFTLLATDGPAVLQAAEGLGSMVFGNAGVDYEVIPTPVGTADMTPQLQAAVDGGADAIGMTGDLTFCSSFLQGYQTLGLDQTRYIISTCIDPTTVEAYASVLEGSMMTGTTGSDPEEEALYGAIVDTYGEDIDPDPAVSTGHAAGVIPLLTFVNLMDGFTGDPTPAAVTEQARTATGVPLFLGSGATFTCDGTAIPMLPNVCSAATQLGTVNAEGKIEDSGAHRRG